MPTNNDMVMNMMKAMSISLLRSNGDESMEFMEELSNIILDKMGVSRDEVKKAIHDGTWRDIVNRLRRMRLVDPIATSSRRPILAIPTFENLD